MVMAVPLYHQRIRVRVIIELYVRFVIYFHVVVIVHQTPSDKAVECFPSNIEDGYTPAGWEPLSCSDSGGGVSLLVGGSTGGWLLPLILFLSISYVTSSFMLV